MEREFTWESGSKYEGDFLENSRTGKSIFTWTDGSRYEGDFLEINETVKVFTLGLMETNMKEIFKNKRTGKCY